jgi:hypothetical protein
VVMVFVNEIVRLHGIPKKIIHDHGLVFTCRFLIGFWEDLETKLNFSTTYHPKTYD